MTEVQAPAREAARPTRDGPGATRTDCCPAANQHEPLPAEDLEPVGVAAYLTGSFDAASQAWEGPHRAFIERDQLASAVRCSFWHALTLFQHGEHARGGGWLSRAQGVLEESGLDCVERGYLRIPGALRILDGGDPASAYSEFDEIAFSSPSVSATRICGASPSSAAVRRSSCGVKPRAAWRCWTRRWWRRPPGRCPRSPRGSSTAGSSSPVTRLSTCVGRGSGPRR